LAISNINVIIWVKSLRARKVLSPVHIVENASNNIFSMPLLFMTQKDAIAL
jgi:hypothetical protein